MNDLSLLLQAVPPRALVMAMTLAYTLCFAGMLFAYLAYRRKQAAARKDGERSR
jgi:hypothetical protein